MKKYLLSLCLLASCFQISNAAEEFFTQPTHETYIDKTNGDVYVFDYSQTLHRYDVALLNTEFWCDKSDFSLLEQEDIASLDQLKTCLEQKESGLPRKLFENCVFRMYKKDNLLCPIAIMTLSGDFTKQLNEIKIDRLVVAEHCRQKGLATALLNKVETFLDTYKTTPQQEKNILLTVVEEDKELLIPFYTKRGFIIHNEAEGEWVEMKKTVQSSLQSRKKLNTIEADDYGSEESASGQKRKVATHDYTDDPEFMAILNELREN